MIETFELNSKVIGKRNILTDKLLRPGTKGIIIRRYIGDKTGAKLLDVQYADHSQDTILESWITKTGFKTNE